ncbi:hypothetical protein [Leptospira mayottensis]|uniref:Uncharacterized protein n=2 Tax=Leptospira mayottensis TaxID=1137606 RepID=A0AA87SX88_9LEPT|nr:hypothetical protein [Leptospira mayottensis]AXR66615.1 hypothetical protein DQM28_20715 [Leptospira mayottensis]AZQ04256.1 hypothetical protein LEP1GSC190_19650 [Leptospira mayottensis 200901116]EKR98067.1 hypothetical protein LEP1GSC125_1530 [Leptospira mayottensis 200901122]TGN04343.1 hypothetical protein EHR03_10905 [Leptospira mayottensis]
MSKNPVPSNSNFPTFLFAEFLESQPPNQISEIKNLFTKKDYNYYPSEYILNLPEIQLHCSNDLCNGTRFFRSIETDPILINVNQTNLYITYQCSNCQKYQKIFSLFLFINAESNSNIKSYAFKFGEFPNFGPVTPSRLIKLIGPDREIFLKGRQCENQGLGIGAYGYYRRVVESQKNRILEEIKKIAQKEKMNDEKILLIERAIAENQFSKAVETVQRAIPESILMNGHNPLKILHNALSEGLHSHSDEQCLILAQSIRVVLIELSDRISSALKDERELKQALNALLNKKHSNP